MSSEETATPVFFGLTALKVWKPKVSEMMFWKWQLVWRFPLLLSLMSTSQQLSLSDSTLYAQLLLMEEILHHLGCIKPCKQWDRLPTSTGDRRISEPSTVFPKELNLTPQLCISTLQIDQVFKKHQGPGRMEGWGHFAYIELYIQLYLYPPVNKHSHGKSPLFLINTIKMVHFPWVC